MRIHQAVKHMRELTNNGVPFSVEYIGLNNRTGKSSGLKVVSRALLRPTRNTSTPNLLSYIDADTDEPRHMHLPLVLKFNGKLIFKQWK